MACRSVVVATISAALLTVGTVGSPQAGAQVPPEPSLGVSPDRAEAGDEVEVSGHCDVVGGTMTLHLDPGNVEIPGSVPFDQNGNFSASVRVPQVDPDQYDLSGPDGLSCGSDPNLYVVSLDLDRDSGLPGEQVNATGVCSDDRGSVSILFDGSPMGSATVDYSTGEFGFTFTVPDVTAASHGVTTDCGGHASLEVLAPVLPTLVLDPTTGYARDGVSATGTCPVDSGSVEIVFDDTAVGSATVDSSTGEFATSFPVPAVPAGSYDVTTTCEGSDSFEVLPPVVVPPVDPTLVLDPTTGYAGDGVSATGTCPVDSGSVEIVFGGSPVGSVAVDSSTGEFATSFPVPAVPAGSYDVTTSCEGSDSFEVLPPVVVPPVDPTLGLDPTSGYAGEGVSATGTCPVDSDSVEIFFDGEFVDLATVDSSTGEFSVTFTVPDVLPRSYDVTSDCGGRASFEVVATPVVPALELSPARGHVGDVLASTGSCPVAAEAAELFFGNSSVGFVTVDSSTGEFGPVGFPVPDVPPGSYDVTTDCGGRASFEVLAVEPTLDLDPASGQVDDEVSATGTCPVSSGSVEILFEGESVGSATVDSSTGEFGSVEFGVPVVEVGVHEVTTDCGGAASFDVLPVGAIPATLELDPAQGELGVDVTASGTCPLDHTDVTLLLDDRTVATTDGDPETGEFQVVIPMLGLEGPAHTVTTSCGASEEFTLVVPPPSTTRTGPGTGAGEGTSTPPRERPSRPRSELPTPTPIDTPQGLRIIVPDLTGLTEDEVITALGDQLTLAERTGRPGVVTRQLPLAGTLVEPGSEVSILLAEPEVATLQTESRFPLALLTILMGALISALLFGARVRRRYTRERRWVDTEVRTELETAEPALPDVPEGSAPGLEVRLELRRDPTHLRFREVGRAHD